MSWHSCASSLLRVHHFLLGQLHYTLRKCVNGLHRGRIHLHIPHVTQWFLFLYRKGAPPTTLVTHTLQDIGITFFRNFDNEGGYNEVALQDAPNMD